MAIRAHRGWLEAAAMSALPPYHVSAYNTAKSSENKIHDDATAKRFGFKGGLVGGVMSTPTCLICPCNAGGAPGWSAARARPASGSRSMRATSLKSPLSMMPTGMSLQVQQRRRAVRHRPGGAAGIGPGIAGPHSVPVGARSRSSCRRRRADLEVGDWLGMNPLTVTPEYQTQDIADTRETDPLYLQRRYRAFGHRITLLQLGFIAQRHSAGVDAHGQHGPKPRASRALATRSMCEPG